MPKTTEHTLVRALLKELSLYIRARVGVVRKHADYVKSGTPDITVTYAGHTSWWEAKHAHPRIIGTGLQLEIARRLEESGHCRYIVYLNDKGSLSTHIVRPSEIKDDGTWTPEFVYPGHNHKAVRERIMDMHRRLDA